MLAVQGSGVDGSLVSEQKHASVPQLSESATTNAVAHPQSSTSQLLGSSPSLPSLAPHTASAMPDRGVDPAIVPDLLPAHIPPPHPGGTLERPPAPRKSSAFRDSLSAAQGSALGQPEIEAKQHEVKRSRCDYSALQLGRVLP